MRYKARSKDYRLIVRAKASFGESIDTVALDAFSRVFIRGFLKAKLIKKNLVEYSGPIGISLQERLKKPISKRDFLFIIEQLVLAVQKVEGNRLQLNNVLMDLENVYINDTTKEVQFLYVPLTNGNGTVDIYGFVEKLVYSATPIDSQETEFFSRFIHFIRTQETFCPEIVEKYIAKEDRSVVNTIKKQNVGQSGFMTSKKQHYYEHYEDQKQESGEMRRGDQAEHNFSPKVKIESVHVHKAATVNISTKEVPVVSNEEATGVLDEEATGVLDEEATGVLDEEATGVLDEEATGVLDEEATGVLYEEATGVLHEEATGVLNEEGTGVLDEEGTGVLDEEGTQLLEETKLQRKISQVVYPVLFRVLTEEKISINKPVFRLGKERSYVDYFVTNNNAVSRSHADIITRGKKYFVIDLNSKNHTYVNDQMVAVQCETELRDGDRLRLGNEEFIFQIPREVPANVCRRCGNKIERTGRFCSYCGLRIER